MERDVVLVVDDEDSIRSALTTLLGRAGYTVLTAAAADTALQSIMTQSPALVLLDVVLDEANPHQLSGLDVLRRIRALERFVPVIMLTSYTEWQIESLGQGAIAFITKPWDANALLGQIRSTLSAVSHIRREGVQPQNSTRLMVADVELDMIRYKLYRGGQEIDLTPMEFALLAFLARHPDREWTREQLLNQVWGYEWVGYERTIDRHIAALRRKLRLQRDELIETVHGTGYRLIS